MKNTLLSILCCCFLLLSNNSASAQEIDVLRIGTLPAADSILLYAANNEGYFEENNIQIEIIPFQSAVELGAAMRAQALDGHFGDIINVLMQNATGAPQKIVATTSYATENQRHFAIVASPKLEDLNIENLANARVAIGNDTIIDYLYSQMTSANNLESNYFALEDIRAIPLRLQMLMLGEVDAALLPEPLVTTVEAQGAHVIFDDTTLSEPLAVIALRNDVITDDLVHRFRDALYKAAMHINEPANRETYIDIMVEVGLLSEQVKDVYPLLQFDTELLPNYLPSEEDIANYITWMQAKGILSDAPLYEEIVWQAQ